MRLKPIIILAFGSIAATAASQSLKDEFNAFRNNMMGEYSEFRKSVLSNYDSFLETVWAEFEVFGAKTKDSEPKPEKAPKAEAPAPTEDTLIPLVEDVPVQKVSITVDKTITNIPLLQENHTESPALALPVPALPTKPVSYEDISGSNYAFPFHGVEIEVEDIDFDITMNPTKWEDYAKFWRHLRDNEEVNEFVAAYRKMVEKYNLNDYLTLDALMWYLNNRYPDLTPSQVTATAHYILANLGYDVRIGVDKSDRPFLLAPFSQIIYGRRNVKMNGRLFYVFVPDTDNIAPELNGNLSCCIIPDDIDAGAVLDLKINDLKLPVEKKQYDLAYGPLHLTGEYNANIMPVLLRYPQTDISEYAASEVLPEVRKELVEQVRTQLAGMSQIEAVNALLQFSQSAFDYAVDRDVFGFEKPYFLEENLFYPQNDCEDRVIFYTYLLWNALGLENHLLQYPGHESASVNITEGTPKGDYYLHDDKRFYISDPTYIGSKTGMCMPRFRTERPIINMEYK